MLHWRIILLSLILALGQTSVVVHASSHIDDHSQATHNCESCIHGQQLDHASISPDTKLYLPAQHSGPQYTQGKLAPTYSLLKIYQARAPPLVNS